MSFASTPRPVAGPTAADIALGRHLVARGWLDPERLRQCMAALRASAPHVRLADLLRSHGVVAPAAVQQATDELLQQAFASRPISSGSDVIPVGSDPEAKALPPEVLIALGDPARRIGRYALLGELGRGGMGVVHRAFDAQLQRPVAIKLLGGGGPVGEQQRARFAREARAAARLRHPGIVAVHEVGEHEGRPYLVMDLVEGESFDAILDHGPVSPRRVAEIVRDVARALAHAHEQGIVHRDVKPGNILLERPRSGQADPLAPAAGRPLITDFGLATELSSSTDKLTMTGQLLGTPQYMAPEQAGADRNRFPDADGARVGPGADVYGLGGVLYRALAGRPPFDEGDLIPLLRKVLTEEPDPLRKHNPDVHRDLETIAGKCLEKSPLRRYASAADLADDLDRFCNGEPIAARPPTRVERARRWVRRRPLVAVLSSAAALVVAVGLGAGGWAILEVRRRVAAQRVRFVEDARTRARETARAFERARAEPAPAEESPEAARRRLDGVLALGLDALSAATTLCALAREDAAAARDAFDVAIATGEVALQTEQWGVARSTFDKALALEVDDARARRAIERVEAERRRIADEHRAVVERVLAQARSGELARQPGGHETALFTLVRYPEAQTVELLGRALDSVSDELREETRRLYHGAEQPTEEEARAGSKPIAGLRETVDRWLALEPGAQKTRPMYDALKEAEARLSAREARRRPEGLTGRPLSARELEAQAQQQALTAGERALARLCCEALGRIGLRDGAVGALGRYLFAEASQQRAAPAGIALCQLGGEEAMRIVAAAGPQRFGGQGAFWEQVSRWVEAAGGAGGDAPLLGESAADYVQRGMMRDSGGDHEGAIEDYSRAIEADPTEARAWNNRGIARYRAGDLDGAIADLTRALELDPSLAQSWTNRGNMLLEKGDVPGAIADHTRALERDPQMTLSLVNRAECYKRLGEPEKARADLDRAVAVEPEHALAWAGRAVVRDAQGDQAGALEDFAKALAIDPGLVQVYRARCHTHVAAGRLTEALADATRAVELVPRDPEVWVGRGDVRKHMGDLRGAMEDYGQALELAPDNVPAWIGRGLALYRLGDHGAAIGDLRRATGLAPANPAAWAGLGTALYGARNFDGAFEALSRALELDPRNASAWSNRAMVRYFKRDARGAIDDCTRAIEIAPGYAAAWCNRGIARSATGDHRGALADYDRALALDPKIAQAYVNRGTALFELKELQRAIDDFTRAFELDPTLAQALVNRGSARDEAGDREGALSDYTRAIELAPRLPEGWYNRAHVRRKTGDVQGAIADYERCLELNPRHHHARQELAALRQAGR